MTGTLRRRAHAHEELDSEGSWAISYGDMITLLLTFFMIFFNIEKQQEEKQQELQASMLEALSSQARRPAADSGVEHRLLVGAKQGDAIDETLLQSWGGTVRKEGTRVIVEFPGLSFFPSSKTRVTKEGEAALARFAQTYLPYAGRHLIGVRAYTDGKPVMQIAGRNFQDNLELSALRAISAMRSLQKAGLPLARMRIAGFGELRVPAALVQPTENSLAHARTVVLVIEPELKEKQNVTHGG
jgi:flagellar motor protein MotB